MPRDEKEVVSELEHELARRIGPARFDLWFGKRVRLGLANGSMTVWASNQFELDCVRKQFTKAIQEAAEHVLQRTVPLNFAVQSRPAAAEANADQSAPVPIAARPHDDPPNETPKASPAQGQRRSGASRPRARYARLDDFVVGTENRVAFTAAQSAIERPGSCSPLFLYGPTGSGKTHLLEGVWLQLRQRTKFGRVLMLSAEQFTSHFLVALRGGGLPSFRRKCREVELLAIDDIQFFAGKRATIVELQHTVDALLRGGRQLVLTSDRSPAMLGELGSELTARFSGGLVCAIDSPDYATRLGIAQRMAARMQVKMPPEVLELVAAEMCGDARQIAGALNRLQATSQAHQQPVTRDMAQTALQDVFRATQRAVRLKDVERAVCEVFGLEPKSLRENSKAKAISQPRMLAMWLARKYTRAAFSEISQYFGRKSHSTVISAEKKVNGWVVQRTSIQLGHSACEVQDAIRRIEMQLRTG